MLGENLTVKYFLRKHKLSFILTFRIWEKTLGKCNSFSNIVGAKSKQIILQERPVLTTQVHNI